MLCFGSAPIPKKIKSEGSTVSAVASIYFKGAPMPEGSCFRFEVLNGHGPHAISFQNAVGLTA